MLHSPFLPCPSLLSRPAIQFHLRSYFILFPARHKLFINTGQIYFPSSRDEYSSGLGIRKNGSIFMGPRRQLFSLDFPGREILRWELRGLLCKGGNHFPWGVINFGIWKKRARTVLNEEVVGCKNARRLLGILTEARLVVQPVASSSRRTCLNLGCLLFILPCADFSCPASLRQLLFRLEERPKDRHVGFRLFRTTSCRTRTGNGLCFLMVEQWFLTSW